jgi:anaerobic ribonucleoside-triphosphate reductase activating protein
MVPDTSHHGCRTRLAINLAGFLARSAVNGPGIRGVVWVQGCPIRCEGCFNKEFQPFSPAQYITPEALAGRVLAIGGIEGVTFTGGEPFAQAGPLAVLGGILKEGGLNVVTYSGFSYDHIRKMNRPSWQRLLAVTDLLIAGPYVPEKKCSAPYIGSSNQQVVQLTGAITVPHGAGPLGYGNVEFTITPEGSVITTGFPDPAFATRFVSGCREG